jgi:hypothetical protein
MISLKDAFTGVMELRGLSFVVSRLRWHWFEVDEELEEESLWMQYLPLDPNVLEPSHSNPGDGFILPSLEGKYSCSLLVNSHQVLKSAQRGNQYPLQGATEKLKELYSRHWLGSVFVIIQSGWAVVESVASAVLKLSNVSSRNKLRRVVYDLDLGQMNSHRTQPVICNGRCTMAYFAQER